MPGNRRWAQNVHLSGRAGIQDVGLWGFQSGWHLRDMLWRGGNRRDGSPKIRVQFLLEILAECGASLPETQEAEAHGRPKNWAGRTAYVGFCGDRGWRPALYRINTCGLSAFNTLWRKLIPAWASAVFYTLCPTYNPKLRSMLKRDQVTEIKRKNSLIIHTNPQGVKIMQQSGRQTKAYT